MPRTTNYPILFDECKTVSISDLLRWGYLKINCFKRGTITWSRGSERTGSISITMNNQVAASYLELEYTYNDKPIKYRVRLTSTPSNLGKGVYWFFMCAQTGKRCRKLYLVDGYFLHRSEFHGCFYEKQTYSSSKRSMCQSFEKLFGTDKLFDELYSKHFKQTYAGKPTKRARLPRRIVH